MNEYSLIYSAGLSAGLAPSPRWPVNAQALYSLVNGRPTEGGVEGVDSLDQNLVVPELDWPFPQAFETAAGVWLAHRTRIDRVNDDYSLTPEIAYCTPGGVWRMAEHGDYVLLSNGVVTARYDPLTASWATINDRAVGLYSATIPCSNAVCNFKGQLLAGGVRNPPAPASANWYGADAGWIAWSRPGTEDFTIDRTNLAGVRPMPRGGEVHQIARLGDAVMVYAADGVYRLEPVSDPAPGWRVVELANIGIIAPGAVGAWTHEHVWIDHEGWLWRVSSADYTPRRVGHRDRFQPDFDGPDIVISWNAAEREWYLCNGSTTYLLNEYGMGELPRVYSSGWLVENSWTAPSASSGHAEADNLFLVTEQFDMNYTGRKTIQWVAVSGVIPPGTLEIAVDWNNNPGGPMTRTPFRKANAHGAARIPISASRFRVAVRVRGFHAALARIDRIEVRYQYCDRRFARGGARPPKTGTGDGAAAEADA